jgi:hypothetical protein
MQIMTRRNVTKLVAACGLAAMLFAAPIAARADGFLVGTWKVRCENGHDDQVEDITRNHTCEHSGCGKKSVDGGKAKVVCPDGHATQVEGVTRQHKCTQKLDNGGECAKQCLRG